MLYRLELTIGERVPSEAFTHFLQALAENALHWRLYAGTQSADTWRREHRPGGAEAWLHDYDSSSWAEAGTSLLLALILIGNQPNAAAWQVLGPAAVHPAVGLRLLQQRSAGWTEIYRLP